LESVTDRSSPILAKIDKPIRGGGSINDAVRFSGPQGFSYDLAAAQAVSAQVGRGGSEYDEYNLPFGEYHGSVVMSARGLLGSKGKEDAYLTELASEMDGSLEAFGSIAARKIFGPVGGAIGKITAIGSGSLGVGELTLTIKNDAFNFVPGQILQAAAADGSSTTTPRAGLGYVIGVFPDGDTDTTMVRVATSRALAIAGTAGTPSGWVDADFLFRNGDILSATDLSDKQVRSLQGFITLAASVTTYLGVARAAHAGLSGFRMSAAATAGLSIKERIEKLVNVGRKQYNANSVDTIGVGPDTWMELSQDVQDHGWLAFGNKVEIGAGEIVIITANGPVKVVNEPHILESDIWALTMKNLKLYTYNGFPGPADEDGLKMVRQAAAPNYEVRWNAFNCLSISGKPWTFGRCSSGVTSL
jgi:hypothetical protein